MTINETNILETIRKELRKEILEEFTDILELILTDNLEMQDLLVQTDDFGAYLQLVYKQNDMLTKLLYNR